MFGLDLSMLSTGSLVLFGLCILAVCAFEFINGFHDTANAVATVIYTKSLRPKQAVILSGLFNFLGVFVGVGVAMGIIKLMPLGDMMGQPIGQNIALILAILVAAIGWNLGTWYFGIPCSSSHTLIGSLLGGGLGFQMMNGGGGPNWEKAQDIGMSLLLSPLVGFALVIILMILLRQLVKNKELFQEPDPNSTPPTWIRAILITTCSLVSFGHGSNDGQKGIGLLMILLLAFFPIQFALNPSINIEGIKSNMATLHNEVNAIYLKDSSNSEAKVAMEEYAKVNEALAAFSPNDTKSAFKVRKAIQGAMKSTDKVKTRSGTFAGLSQTLFGDHRSPLQTSVDNMHNSIDYAPLWAMFMISISLGLGTMIGWKRIVVTIGEKIGKSHLTYAQGAVAELVTATMLYISTSFKLPVSTTHILSSGVAGSMVAAKGVKNLQKGTIGNILLAWVLTLPVTILLSMGLFFLFRLFA
jgi:phosphate/sulfate permease